MEARERPASGLDPPSDVAGSYVSTCRSPGRCRAASDGANSRILS